MEEGAGPSSHDAPQSQHIPDNPVGSSRADSSEKERHAKELRKSVLVLETTLLDQEPAAENIAPSPRTRHIVIDSSHSPRPSPKHRVIAFANILRRSSSSIELGDASPADKPDRNSSVASNDSLFEAQDADCESSFTAGPAQSQPLIKLKYGAKAVRFACRLIRQWRRHKELREARGCILSRDSRYAFVYAKLYDELMNACEVSKSDLASSDSKWRFATSKAVKLGHGIVGSSCKDVRLLDVSAWLEMVDTKHRYGHNLRIYHKHWLQTEDPDRFFHWLDFGRGMGYSDPECDRKELEEHCVEYCDNNSRTKYQYTQSFRRKEGKVRVYLTNVVSGKPLHTYSSEGKDEGKHIFVMDTSWRLYVNRKAKGRFHHSSFLSGGVTLMAGRLKAKEGFLERLEPHSGHYRPSVQNLEALYKHWEDKGVDMSTINFGRPKDWEGAWPFDGQDHGEDDKDKAE